jgi:hypothetical protein
LNQQFQKLRVSGWTLARSGRRRGIEVAADGAKMVKELSVALYDLVRIHAGGTTCSHR